jgi:hypothetical protein
MLRIHGHVTFSQSCLKTPSASIPIMPLRILSFFNENITWRVAKTPDGYYHRQLSGTPEWLPGLPSGVPLEMVKSTFQQFPSTDDSLQPSHLSFKLTYRVGHSNVECFIFASPEGDPFLVKIPPATFAALQEAFPSIAIPRMRIARLAAQQAIHLDLPSVELLTGTPLFETVQSQLSESLPQHTKS